MRLAAVGRSSWAAGCLLSVLMEVCGTPAKRAETVRVMREKRLLRMRTLAVLQVILLKNLTNL